MSSLAIFFLTWAGITLCLICGFVFGRTFRRQAIIDARQEGYDQGLKDSLDNPKALTAALRNDFAKLMNKGGSVPEFIAPGQMTLVDTDESWLELVKSLHNPEMGCIGCRYSGRALLVPPADGKDFYS